MGGALIELMRARYAPGISSAWALASRPTEAERFAREVSLRWERAAAELEELIRARGWAPAAEDAAETAGTARVRPAPARLDRSVAPLYREADPPRRDPARRIRSSPDRRDTHGRRMPVEPSRILAEGPEAWSASGELADARSRHARGGGAPEPEREPDPPSRPEGSDDPTPPDARRRLQPEAPPSRGSLAAGPGEAPWRRAGPVPRGDDFDRDGVIEVPRAPLEEPRFPRRAAGGFSPDAVASERAAGPGSSGLEESPRYPRRDGSTAPDVASRRGPRRGAPPGPRLDLLVEEARRRAEALEDWERTGF